MTSFLHKCEAVMIYADILLLTHLQCARNFMLRCFQDCAQWLASGLLAKKMIGSVSDWKE